MKKLFIIAFIFFPVICFSQSNLDRVQQRDVWIQDQTTPPFHRYFMKEEKTDITLVYPILKGNDTMVVSSGHGFSGGDWALISYGEYSQQTEIVSVNEDTVIITGIFGASLPIDGTNIIRGKIDMVVNGSVSDSIYYCRITGDAPIDIQYFHVFLTDNLEGDDSKFGGIAALTNGVLFYKETDIIQNLGTYKKNQDFIQFGGDPNYLQKAGGGEYSMDFAFDMRKKYGIVIRVDPIENESIVAIIRDNLTELSTFRIAAFGQTTLGE